MCDVAIRYKQLKETKQIPPKVQKGCVSISLGGIWSGVVGCGVVWCCGVWYSVV